MIGIIFVIGSIFFRHSFSLTQNQRQIVLDIDENVPIGTKLVDLQTKLPSDHGKFSFTSNPFFNIRENSQIYTKGLLDRDKDRELCINPEFPTICQWSTILVSDVGGYYYLKITINDVNDNPPQWEISHIHLKIPENTHAGYKLEFPLAKDDDHGINGIQYYSILPKSSIFFIPDSTTEERTPILILKSSKLDRELNAWHNLTLIAMDGGIHRLSGTIPVSIEVLDENDNSPLFESSFYQVSIGEDISPGTNLPLNIRAFDLDSGNFGKLTFKFALSTPQHVLEIFSISPTTAKLISRKTLNFKNRRRFYDFEIVAQDGGIPPKITQTRVKIEIIDKNTHPPEIKITPMPDPTAKFIVVPENSDLNRVVASFTVEDKDSGINGKFNCSLTGLNPRDFHLKHSRQLGKLEIYVLQTRRSFDREIESFLSISISCQDQGVPPLTGSVDVLIEVEDVNDHSPVFQQLEYRIRTTEGNAPNSLVYHVIATDMDSGENARLRYHIVWPYTETQSSPFRIDSDGRIYAKTVLDRETNPKGYTFQVMAFDHGLTPRNETTVVIIELEDLNDCVPQFNKPHYNFHMKEDYGDIYRRRQVGEVYAEDQDLRENSVVYYRLSQDINVPFEIDSKSGSIYTSRLLDREAFPSQISFLCMAVDNPNNLLYRKTATVEVTVDIIDENDNKPKFIFPNETQQDINLSYYARKDQIVMKVVAKDQDLGLNARLKYIIIKGNALKLFTINELTGIIYLTTDLKPYNKGYEILTIKAIDSGLSQTHMSLSQIRIVIDDFPLIYVPDNDNSNSKSITEPNLRGFLHFDWWEPNKMIIICILLVTALISCILIGAICVMAKRRNADVEKNDIKMLNIESNSLYKPRLSQSSMYDDTIIPYKADLELTTDKLLRIELPDNLFIEDPNRLQHPSPNYMLT